MKDSFVLHKCALELNGSDSTWAYSKCTIQAGCVEKLLRKITQVGEIIDKQDLVPKVFQISPSVSYI